MNNNYYRIVANINKLLDKVSTTGKDEAGQLAEAGLFIDMILRGEVKFVEPEQPAQPQPPVEN